MFDRSIRSIALDYYRKRGAEIRPLDGESDAFEIKAPAAPALTVTFARDAEAPAVNEVNATSPQWRAILEDLTAEVAVSYRYLAAGAIGRPATTLGAAMPEGWAVRVAKLLEVDHRVAVGFTHRVTFDSPALNSCTEVIHHHLWDVAHERRLTSFESRLYELPCIMIRPERIPPEATVQGLLGRSLAAVDEASDLKGREIERELAELLSDAERRTNQYFEQQLGNVLQREVTLQEKLDGVIRRMAEARTQEAVMRYRAEGESLSRQLDYARANREAELGAVETACHTKLQTEREKHELTATTDLIALCHASYDVLSYRADVTSPEGIEASWVVRYWPVSGELELPACKCCARPMREPVAVTGGGFACNACVITCEGCGSRHEEPQAGACGVCASQTCTSCQSACVHCAEPACNEHARGCITCEAAICARCASQCHACNEPLCQHHARLDPATSLIACDRHASVAPAPVRNAGHGAPAKAVTISTVAIPALPPEVDLAPLPTEVMAFEPRAIEPVAEQAQDATLAALFSRPQPVISKLSGRALHPKLAETCPHCRGHFAVQEMVDCPTCCTPSCKSCSQGEHGPCPACDALDAVDAADERLDFVKAEFPQLAKGRRHWELAQAGPYVLTHWSRLGTWGMVVYHQQPDGEPVVVTAFDFGRLDTLKQTLKGWWN
jgi:hypothetical protein